MNEFICPTCGCYNSVPNWMERFTCACGLSWQINPDAEMVDGIWRDLTVLSPIRDGE